jgi:hypothetical protein
MTSAPETQNQTGWPAALPPQLEAFLVYWRTLETAAGGIPPRRLVDPLLIPRALLPNIGLVEARPADDRLNLRFRLLGTGHRRATGRDYSGRSFDDLYTPQQVLDFEHEYRLVLESGQPGFARRSSLKLNREFIVFQRILAPLLDEAGRARHVIGYWHWENTDL